MKINNLFKKLLTIFALLSSINLYSMEEGYHTAITLSKVFESVNKNDFHNFNHYYSILEKDPLTSLNPCYRPEFTILHLCAANGNLLIFKRITNAMLARDIAANTNPSTETGITPYGLAVSAGHLDIVKEYINELLPKQNPYANLNPAINTGETPLLIAAMEGYFHIYREICNTMLEKNQLADINPAMPDGTTPLHMAAEKGYSSLANGIIDTIISQVNTNIEIIRKHNAEKPENPITEPSKTVISSKINPIKIDGVTPLHLAAQKGTLDVVKKIIKILINQNPNININMTSRQGTVLNIAKKNRHIQIARYIEYIIEIQRKFDTNHEMIKLLINLD